MFHNQKEDEDIIIVFENGFYLPVHTLTIGN